MKSSAEGVAVYKSEISTNFGIGQSVEELLETLFKGILYAHLNVRGISNKLVQMKIMLHKGPFGILTLAES